MEVLTRMNLRKQKSKPEAKKLEFSRRTRPEMAQIMPNEEVIYAASLKSLKKWQIPEGLGVHVHGIGDTCTKDHLVEFICVKEDRRRQKTNPKPHPGASVYVHNLISGYGSFFGHRSAKDIKVSQTKRPSRGTEGRRNST